MLQNIGTTEIIIIGVVLVVLFGAKKIPEFARGLAEASKEFRHGLREDSTESEKK